MREWQWHNKSELEERENETNENCPAEQEWHNKLLMEREGGRKDSRREEGEERGTA